MALNEILQERKGQSLILTFNRPEHANALTLDMATQLFTILKNATTDQSVRAVLLRGAGGNYMDGRDKKIYSQDINDVLEDYNKLILPYHSAIREMQAMDKPIISLVQGRVAGAGFSFMLASDLVISASSAIFNTHFVENAMSPDGGCSYFLTRKVGMSRAVEMLMLCEEFDAEWAHELSLVNRVVDDSLVEQEALLWLEKLTQGPTKAYGAVKKLALRAFDQDLHAQLGLEHTMAGHNSRGFDFREKIRAKAAGREPRYTGT